MVLQKPKKNREHQLLQLAAGQHGYFTAGQARRLGYVNQVHAYHVQNGHWLRMARGIYRLPSQADTFHSRLAYWLIWSHNQEEQPQAVISHYSALACHKLGDFELDPVHLTVPVGFRKKNPPGCLLHKASLSLSQVDGHEGLMFTNLRQTLLDLQPELLARGRWEEVEAQARARGLSFEPAQEEASREAASAIRPAPPSHRLLFPAATVQDSTAPAESFSAGRLTGEPPRTAAGDSILPSGPQMPAGIDSAARLAAGSENESPTESPMPERIFEMICNRTFRPRPSRAQAGFTLVELLVVVSIISVLAAMLLPALSQTLATARQIQCANNQKQLALAVLLYADNASDYLPASTCWPNWNANVRFWFDKLRTAGHLTSRDTWTKLKDNPNRITVCPAAGQTNPPGVSGSYVEIPASDADWTPSTYGTSYRLLGNQVWLDTGGLPKQAMIRNASAAVFFIDALMMTGYPWMGSIYFAYWNPTHFQGVINCAPPRHTGRVNAGHADGHVSSFAPIPAAFLEDRWKDMFPVN